MVFPPGCHVRLIRLVSAGTGKHARLYSPIRFTKLSKISTFIKAPNYGVKEKAKRTLGGLRDRNTEAGGSNHSSMPQTDVDSLPYEEKQTLIAYSQLTGKLVYWTHLPGGSPQYVSKAFKSIYSFDAEIPLLEIYPKEIVRTYKNVS